MKYEEVNSLLKLRRHLVNLITNFKCTDTSCKSCDHLNKCNKAIDSWEEIQKIDRILDLEYKKKK